MEGKSDRKSNRNIKQSFAVLPGTFSVVLALLLILSALPVYGAQRKAGSSAAKDDNTETEVDDAPLFRVHLADEPEDPVPAKTMDLDTASFLGLLSEGLTALDRDGKVVPGCAKEWKVSDDGLRWEFTLREDLCWSDGKPLEAKYFETLFKTIADPASETPYGQDLVKNIAGYDEVLKGSPDKLKVSARGKTTLVIHFSTPDPGFARSCASITLLPLREDKKKDTNKKAASDEAASAGTTSAAAKEAAAAGTTSAAAKAAADEKAEKESETDQSSASVWKAVTGNGPYRIVRYYEGKGILLKRNTYYKNESRGIPFAKLFWRFSGDRNQEYSDLLNGDFGAISDIPPEEKAVIRQASETDQTISEQTVPYVTGILFNCRRDLFKKEDVRRALCMTIDRKYISSSILKNIFVPADSMSWFEGQHSGKESAQTDDENAFPSGSLKKAKALLKESYGSKESLPSLTILADENGAVPQVAAYLAALWRDMGFEVEVKTSSAEKIAQKKTDGKYDVICTNLLLPSDLPSVELGKYISDNESNVTGFSDDKYDDLMKKALREKDRDKSTSLMKEAAGILARKLPAAPLVIRSVNWMVSRTDGQEKGAVFCDPSGRWQVWEKTAESSEPEKDKAGAGTENVSDPAKQDGSDPAKQDGSEEQTDRTKTGLLGWIKKKTAGDSAEAEDDTEDETEDNDAAEPTPVKNRLKKLWGEKKQTDDASDNPQEKKSSGIVTLFARFFDAVQYFTKSDTTAWLTRQAYILDGMGEKGKRIASLPKYSEVRLTGTGNESYVRVSSLGKFHYLEADKVTTDYEEVEKLRKKEKEEKLWAQVVTQPLHHVKESELAMRAEEIREKTEKILEDIAYRETLRKQTRNPSWGGLILSQRRGSVNGPSGKETYYNLDMTGVVNVMRSMGNTDEYWVRDDGCKMLGNYIMCAANLKVHPRGSLVETTLGTCIVCDTGGFAGHNSNQIDIAVTW